MQSAAAASHTSTRTNACAPALRTAFAADLRVLESWHHGHSLRLGSSGDGGCNLQARDHLGRPRLLVKRQGAAVLGGQRAGRHVLMQLVGILPGDERSRARELFR